jgi:bifunctional UDP-N-acetylglucosamine pyrophosphorylase/glucosamine-1-phosphate N-acetyltransferase
LRTAQRLNPNPVAIVIGHGAEAVRSAYAGNDVAWILQEQQRGTGHAVLCAKEAFKEFKGEVIILSGDVPFIREQTLLMLVAHHRSRSAALTLLTAFLDEPKGYGRILRDDHGNVTGIVEEKDATLGERGIREVNAGVYVVSAPFVFAALSEIKNHNQQGEYYLPDIVAIGLAQRADIETVRVDDVREMLGINTREELAFMEKNLRQSINKKWMLAGVTFKDPDTTYVEDSVTIGKDTVIGPNTQLRGKTVVGERCQIDGSAFLTDAQIGDEVHLRFSVVMTGCRVANGAIIGPFAHLRPGSNLGPNVHIGNFVETKEAKIGQGTKANHLTYLGDVTIGSEANIGAGTITCNYDGFHKYNTTIGDRVQVGSDTTLIAPVSVPAGALVYNQRDERVREGWTEQKRKKMKGSKK